MYHAQRTGAMMVGGAVLGAPLFAAGKALLRSPSPGLMALGAFLQAVGGLLLSPLLLALAILALTLVVGLPALLLGAARDSIRRRRLVRRIDALDAREAPDAEYDAPFRDLARVGVSGRVVRARLLDETLPSRRRWLERADGALLREIARRPADPLAPIAWAKAHRAETARAVRQWAQDVR
jgi:hypothetical protein